MDSGRDAALSIGEEAANRDERAKERELEKLRFDAERDKEEARIEAEREKIKLAHEHEMAKADSCNYVPASVDATCDPSLSLGMDRTSRSIS